MSRPRKRQTERIAKYFAVFTKRFLFHNISSFYLSTLMTKNIRGPVVLIGTKTLTHDMIIEGPLYIVQPNSKLPGGLAKLDITGLEEDIKIDGAAYVDSTCELTVDLSTVFSCHETNTYGPGCPNYPF